MEEARRRTEASLARKRINVNLANAGASTEMPISPAANSGAMDSLLEKLRAAAPQAKDQRDRRRRARLKERHQVRVASGQKIPDFNDEGDEDGDKQADGDAKVDENGLLSPPIPEDGDEGSKEAQISEGEDVADRAASMLLGLRSNSDANGERQRRRRESADEERRNRRIRRRNGATGSKDSADGSALSSVQEPTSPSRTDSVGTDNQALPSPPHEEAPPSAPPSIIVSEQPDTPSHEPQADGSSASHPIELSD